jgi:alcohol dehydrogenase
MNAPIFQGPGKKALEERPKPTIVAPTEAIVRISKATICGTDLRILKGDVPTCQPARVLGHEGAGVIEAVGPGVVTFKQSGQYAGAQGDYRNLTLFSRSRSDRGLRAH